MHPKVATLMPLNHLERIRDDDYLMALSFLADHPAYLKFFADRVKEGKYVALDNSVVELGEPEPFGSYVRKACAMRASLIMLPDYFQDPELTLRTMNRILAFRSKQDGPLVEALSLLADYHPDIMAIPQGKTIGHWEDCALAMISAPAVNVLGISTRYNGMFGGSRQAAVGKIIGLLKGRGRLKEVKIHLLGCYDDPKEEIALLKRIKIIQGMDSSYPCVLTAHGLSMRKGDPRPLTRGMDFLCDLYDVGLLEDNLRCWWQETEL